jgi:hypothetical protein
MLLLLQSSPIIIKIEQPKTDEVSGLADVLVGSLGITGVMVLLALVAAALFAGVLIWLRSRSPD